MVYEERVKGYERQMAKEELIRIRTALHSPWAKGNDVIDKQYGPRPMTCLQHLQHSLACTAWQQQLA